MDEMDRAKSIFYQKLAKAEREAKLDFQEPDLEIMKFIDEFKKGDEKYNQDEDY